MNFNDLPPWIYNNEDDTLDISGDDQTQEETGEQNGDEPERPPLQGKSALVPPGLYDEPWSSVEDAYGEATLTPYYIEALASDDGGDRDFGIYGLYSATTHQGSVYDSSRMAVPYLVDMLEAELKDPSIMASIFISRIALGENHFIECPRDAEAAKTDCFETVYSFKDRLLDYYNKNKSPELQRLLCFFPGVLPDYPDISFEGAKALVSSPDPVNALAYAFQASALITQGFIAAERNRIRAGYLEDRGDVRLKIHEHIQEVKKLMQESPSLLVRGASAVCLAYSGAADPDSLELLLYLGEQALEDTPWPWDSSFHDIAKAAWLYTVDLPTLLSSPAISSVYMTKTSPGGEKTEFRSGAARMIEAAVRVFPLNGRTQKTIRLPSELNEPEKQVLTAILEQAPELPGGYQLQFTDVPGSTAAILRELGKSDEKLAGEISGLPLWYILETAIQSGNPGQESLRERAVHTMNMVDAWPLMEEIFPSGENGADKCTLGNYGFSGEGEKTNNLVLLMGILAASLMRKTDSPGVFLRSWSGRIRKYEGYDLAFKTPALKIGTALLAVAMAGKLDESLWPMVKPYHRYAEFSAIPLAVLGEILKYTSGEYRKKLCGLHKELLEYM